MRVLSKIRFWAAKTFANRKLSLSQKRELDQFRSELPEYLLQNRKTNGKGQPVALVISSGYLEAIDIVYARTIEAAGYRPLILLVDKSATHRLKFETSGFECIALSALDDLVDWSETTDIPALLSQIHSYEDIKNTRTPEGVMVGMNALATFLRATRSDQFEIEDQSQREEYGKHLNASISYAKIAVAALDYFQPELILMNDRVYSPVAEFFQYALHKGIRVITRNASQKTGYEIIKSYLSPEAIYTHPHSLSKKSWDIVQRMSWDEQHWNDFDFYMRDAYQSGDWFAEVGTQFNKSLITRDGLISALGMDSNKPVAVVFSHIFWDGTLSYGVDLFDNYYDWFRSVLQIAKENTAVNWIFKVHPANLVKAKREGVEFESSEEKLALSVLGEIPEHIKLLSSDTDISTYSLFQLMDYCLTVRGTIGIESAAYGVRTLTAGTGRYDRLGFTHDFDNKADYLQCLSQLEKVPAMSAGEVELARKFAWAIFKMRHLKIEPLDWQVDRDETATQRVNFLKEMYSADFQTCKFVETLKAFCASDDEDILLLDAS